MNYVVNKELQWLQSKFTLLHSLYTKVRKEWSHETQNKIIQDIVNLKLTVNNSITTLESYPEWPLRKFPQNGIPSHIESSLLSTNPITVTRSRLFYRLQAYWNCESYETEIETQLRIFHEQQIFFPTLKFVFQKKIFPNIVT